jgi:hypothetical protein
VQNKFSIMLSFAKSNKAFYSKHTADEDEAASLGNLELNTGDDDSQLPHGSSINSR